MTEELTPLQLEERKAMIGDTQAVIQIVSALRKYRAAAKRMLGLRYLDGECDGFTLTQFERTVEDIEELEG